MKDYVILNNGVKMPRLGFGVYQIDDLAQTQQVVENGLEVGYRLVDTAQIYGNEQAVGDALVHSSIPREIFSSLPRSGSISMAMIIPCKLLMIQ